MDMTKRFTRKPGLFRRWFFRYFPSTAWYWIPDQQEIKVNKYKSMIDDPCDFDQSKHLSFIIIGSALTVIAAFCFVAGAAWLINETVKSLMLIE